MKLIEDLGTMYATDTSKNRSHFGLYECPVCKKHFRCLIYSVTSGNTTKCRKCSDVAIGALKSSKTFITDSARVHGDTYDYAFVEYTNNYTKVQILCKEHSIFWQTPKDHKQGKGCPLCASYGFDKNKSAILYYLRITDNDVIAYKIGVTNRTVQERFNSTDLQKIQVLKTWDFPLGADALTKEQEILELHKEYRYIGEPLLSSGNTELFNIDILGLGNI